MSPLSQLKFYTGPIGTRGPSDVEHTIYPRVRARDGGNRGNLDDMVPMVTTAGPS